jgi:hypothetical protein
LRYPEYFDRTWAYPVGDLAADQRHRARAWATWRLPVAERVGTVSLAAVQQLESGTPYGAVGSVDSYPYVVGAPDYVQAPLATVPYYFTSRDAFRTEWMARTDLAINFARRVGSGSGLEFFAQAQVINVFNQFAAFNLTGGAINTRVLTAFDRPSQFNAFDPFTEVPEEGLHWGKGSRFGQVVDKDAYTLPREFRFSAGVRF